MNQSFQHLFRMNTCVLIKSSKLVFKSLNTAQLAGKCCRPISIFNQSELGTMDKIKILEQQTKILENKVLELVDKLESRKKAIEMKVPKDLIIKSKEEHKDLSDFEQLSIAEEGASKQSSAPKPTNADKNQEEKAAKQRKGGAEKSGVEKPIDVSRLDLRIGKILEVSRHPDADALYVEKIDCGDTTGPRTVISGLVKHVPIDEMKDKHVVVLCNLKPAKMRGILSEAMVMCASTPEKVELLKTPENVKPGDRVTFDNYPGEPDPQLNPKKKIWEQVAPDIKTNEDGIAMYKDCEFKVQGVAGQFRSSLKNVQVR